ncbi:DUF2846 domain-containing protein [Acinetobacter nectaris]|uniref:DUF2846 domain-containing protein n=1 Tax=Acinetobacter nectaris TaxID=1219382 RepID=UPI001F2DA438|nr:DUF2846 domain-containing protein [Acinetobacter nectaris]MCF9047431.1 DUF2846 domain-containing protein [Acinetobacter nectaris]
MNLKPVLPLILSGFFVGCASVPKADMKQTQTVKQFAQPSDGKAIIYVYRSNSTIGAALKKDIWLDGKCLGETARGTFFYKEVDGNQKHTVSTESEFSPNHLMIDTVSGQQYFVQQSIKMGVFVGGADLKQVDELKGKKAISEYELAQSSTCSKQ